MRPPACFIHYIIPLACTSERLAGRAWFLRCGAGPRASDRPWLAPVPGE